MRIGILGPLEVWDKEGRPVRLSGPRLRTLLIRLAVEAGRTVTAQRLADDLWAGQQTGTGPSDAAGALQALVSRLRHAIGHDAIEHSAGGYRLAVSPVEVDAGMFEHLVATARTELAAGDPAGGAAVLRQALSLWRGPALADAADAPFAAGPAARLEELRLSATEERIAADLALGRGAEVAPEVAELAAAHPLRERLRGQLMRTLQTAGRQAEALAVYEETRRMLAEQLGVDPSPELSAVHLAILRQEPGPGRNGATGEATVAGQRPGRSRAPLPPGVGVPWPTGFTLAQTGLARRTNLPAQLTSFIGREAELDRLGTLLGDTRLVTLTGTGGAGKTRLAIEAASRLADHTPDGVWFVPLAAVREAPEVPQAVLAAVGIPEAPRMTDATGLALTAPADRVADALAGKRLVLVLDNCEHLLDAVAALAGRLLAEASGVQILSTSREPLGITGEALCPVPPLPLPPEGAPAAEAASYPAVRLFADRAAAVRPGFAMDGTTATPVVRICRALDGIPLAIELAAARLRSLTAAQVADRIHDRFTLLTRGSRIALPRHQTLRALVDWSWDLLDDGERAVLRRLSVFTGGATPDTAEYVCAPLAGTATVIDVIASLVDKSLVLAAGDGGDVRYVLLETVRVYAAERLEEAGEADRTRAAHAACFLALAEDAEPRLRGAGQLLWLERMTAEHGNCTTAIRHAIDTRDVPAALRFVAALAWFWLMRDYDAEAAEWAAAVRALAGDTAPPGMADALAICWFMAAIGTASAQEGQPDVAGLRDALEQAASRVTADTRYPILLLAVPMTTLIEGDTAGARRRLAGLAHHPDPWVRAGQKAFSGHLALNDGDLTEAAVSLADGYAGFRSIGDRWGMMISLVGRAEVAMARGDPDEAVRLLEEARGHAAEGVAANWGDMLLIPLGRARAGLGDIDGARAELERGVRCAERIGEHDDEASGYVELSELARRGGDLPAARRLLERALAITEPLVTRPNMAAVAARTFSKLGCLAEQEGDLALAADWHGRAMGIVRHTGAPFLPGNPSLGAVVEGFAALAAARGEYVRAAELLGLAHAIHGFPDTGSPEVTRATTAAARALGGGIFAAAYERGRRLSRRDALALVP